MKAQRKYHPLIAAAFLAALLLFVLSPLALPSHLAVRSKPVHPAEIALVGVYALLILVTLGIGILRTSRQPDRWIHRPFAAIGTIAMVVIGGWYQFALLLAAFTK